MLAATHVFFDQRIERPGDEALFCRLERLGERAAEVYDKPDAGLWELRNSKRVHTFSSVMCWAACDRLAKIAARLGLDERSHRWRSVCSTNAIAGASGSCAARSSSSPAAKRS